MEKALALLIADNVCKSEVLSALHSVGYKWNAGQSLLNWSPNHPFVMHISTDRLVIWQNYRVPMSPSDSHQWYHYKNSFDEVTMSAFNFMGQDLERTANFLWEQGYTQQLIDKLTNGATVEQLLSRGGSDE